jgi:hypothetical protein
VGTKCAEVRRNCTHPGQNRDLQVRYRTLRARNYTPLALARTNGVCLLGLKPDLRARYRILGTRNRTHRARVGTNAVSLLKGAVAGAATLGVTRARTCRNNVI